MATLGEQIMYEANRKKDAEIAHNVLAHLKKEKVKVETPRVIKLGRYCKDLCHMDQILKQGGFNTVMEKHVIWLIDMSVGYMEIRYRKNKPEIIFEKGLC